MKIDEAVDIINGTTTVKAKYNNHSIFVCFKFLPFDGHCFLALRADVKTWDSVTLVSGAIDDDGIWIEYGNAMIQVAAVTYAVEVNEDED
ncbi:hypothetical protein [Limosilactobacillus galli]|uniref:hypothetical protein n=1 Tax=Limosilactobacillus galli TaxID=2991834 RepID=UPI0024B9E1A9|nr:hypothetical protein [Limosilactobacillus galli]